MVGDYLIGLLKSWTAWLGAFVLALPDLWPLVQDQVSGLLGAGAFNKVVRIMGILIILVRFRTTQSLAEKGKVSP